MINEFQGKYRFLSNFYEVDLNWQGKIWPSAEHIYQAMKTKDKEQQEVIRSLSSPTKAKQAGSKLILRPLWEQFKVAFMYTIVREKFKQHVNLRQLLLTTGDEELVEGNNWGDTYWGRELSTGIGNNYLGQILMEVRSVLREMYGMQLPLL